MRKAESVANYIIAYGMQIRHPVSNLQLQKILYYIQVYFLKKTGIPFFKDEIEAWQFGPVVPKVYYKYAGFGSAPITFFATPDIDWDTEERKAVNSIVQEKCTLSPWDMVEDTHMEGKPWKTFYEEGKRAILPNEAMRFDG